MRVARGCCVLFESGREVPITGLHVIRFHCSDRGIVILMRLCMQVLEEHPGPLSTTTSRSQTVRVQSSPIT